jgi:hypothetical protein
MVNNIIFFVLLKKILVFCQKKFNIENFFATQQISWLKACIFLIDEIVKPFNKIYVKKDGLQHTFLYSVKNKK